MSDKDQGVRPPPEGEAPRALEYIQTALRGLKFGEVRVVVQDGIVIQVERTERTRLPRRK